MAATVPVMAGYDTLIGSMGLQDAMLEDAVSTLLPAALGEGVAASLQNAAIAPLQVAPQGLSSRSTSLHTHTHDKACSRALRSFP